MAFVSIGIDDDLNLNDISRVLGIKPVSDGTVTLGIQHVNGLIEHYPFSTIEQARATRKEIISSGKTESGKRFETK